MDLSVVIVSFNTREMTLRCLRALHADLSSAGVRYEVLVVDNNSTDGSAEAVVADSLTTTVIRNPLNAGFGAANNIALGQVTGQLVMLLNSDAFVHPGACRAMVDMMNRPDWARVGVLAPRLLNEDGSLQRSVYPFPTPLRAWLENLWLSSLFSSQSTLTDFRHWSHDQARDVPWAIGACLVVRRKAIDEAGLFDERFFMYQEETDWLKRIADRGWLIRFTPDAVVTHLGGASGRDAKARISEHFFNSLDRYELKHHGTPGVILVRMAMLAGCSLRMVAWALMWFVRPRQREVAASKVSLMRWLVWRQVTNWDVLKGARREAL